jgi:AcrR family transcriptional regulator
MALARRSGKVRLSAPERRSAIVQAAIRLFADKGFRGTTTRELAEAAGVTEPVLYQHFATKKDLYTAIIESVCNMEQEAKDSRLEAAEQSGDDRGFFLRLGELILDWHRRHADIIRLLLYSGLGRHELADLFFERHVAVYYRMLSGYLRERIARGAFRNLDPYLAARGFTGMMAHQALAEVIFGDRRLARVRKKLIRTMVDIFLEGVTEERTRCE